MNKLEYFLSVCLHEILIFTNNQSSKFYNQLCVNYANLHNQVLKNIYIYIYIYIYFRI